MAIVRNEAGKIVAKRFAMADIESAMECYLGFCIACGAEREECEPDARRYHCEECGLPHVYGAEELVLMGRVD